MEFFIDLIDRPPIADPETIERGAFQLPVADGSPLSLQIENAIHDSGPIGTVDGVEVLIRLIR